jgi:hypothetical protein
MTGQSCADIDVKTAEEKLAAAAGPYQEALSPAQAVQCAVAVLRRNVPPPQILRERGIHIELPMVQQELAEYLESIRLDEKSHAAVCLSRVRAPCNS